MARPQILLYGPMSGEVRERLAQHFVIREWPGSEHAEPFLAEHAPSIAGVATGGDIGLPNEIIDALPALRIIAGYGVGYERIDAGHAAERGILVTHTPDVLNDEVSNTTIALLLAVTRRIVAYDRYAREGRWAREGSPPLAHGIAGKRVGMVGLGRIGMTIAQKLGVFGCEVVYHSRNRRDDVSFQHYPDLIAMAGGCDILIVITPGGAATRHLVDRPVIDALGPKGTFINVGRGSVVDERELVAALAEGRLGAAGLDVFEDEPNIPPELISMDNVVLLPHVGSATVETRSAMAGLVIDNLVSFFENGKAITPVPECRHLQP